METLVGSLIFIILISSCVFSAIIIDSIMDRYIDTMFDRVTKEEDK